MIASATWHAAVSVQLVLTKRATAMNKSELDAAIANAYCNLGHIKEVTNVTIDDFKDEIVCTVSGHTTHSTAKTPMLSQMTLTFDRQEGCWRIS